jgi:hypothetical protein
LIQPDLIALSATTRSSFTSLTPQHICSRQQQARRAGRRGIEFLGWVTMGFVSKGAQMLHRSFVDPGGWGETPAGRHHE